MQSIQLYIDGQRLDTFKDESVSITQSIQNIKDVSKIFTDFTRTFNVPASKTNNKIFKHYYNYDIINGYDGRKRTAADIELNHMPFRKGYMKLEGVSLKDNSPHTYKLTFFGETIELVDLFGDDELDALDWLDNFNVANWNANTVLGTTATNGLISVGASSTVDGFTYNDAVIVPLITHTDRLYYDSSSVTSGTNNLYHSGALHGVDWLQLKPAVRVHIIIKAIEQKYNIQFSSDFFDTTNTDYYDLRLWLHRNKGDIYGIDENLLIDQITTLPTSNSDWRGMYFNGSSFEIKDVVTQEAQYYTTRISITTASTVEYNFILKNNGIEVYKKEDVTGTNTFNVGDLTNGTYTVFIESTSAILITSGSINATRYDYYDIPNSRAFPIGSLTTASAYYVSLKAQTPKIKVIDFLTGIFKMFNLTAFKKDGVIIVKTLDEYYSDSDKTWDISQFVDVSNTEVLPALPYKDIEFKYKGLDTFLADKHLDLFNKPWATEDYKGAENTFFYGGNYIVELPFEHMKFERLYDENTSSSTPAQYGWFVDKDTDATSMTGDSIKGQPLLFYAVPITDSLGISGLKPTLIRKTQYYIPSNSTGTTDSECINFKAELNEYSGEIFNNTLYDRYYKKYISEIFDSQKRLTKLKAYLPLRILLNYSLADKFSINGQGYKINSITTNLETGLSNFELLNVPVFITAQNEISTTTAPTTTTQPPATPYVNILGSTSQQVGNNVTLTAEDYNFTGSIWAWSGGTAAGKTTKVITVNESSAGAVTYSVTVNGTYTDTHQISWSATPTLGVSISGATSVDEGDVETYSSSVTGTAAGSISYSWSTNGGAINGSSSGSTVSITWNSGGTKSVGLSIVRQSITANDGLTVTVASLVLPTVTTNSYTNISETESTLLGNISSLGNPAYTTKGFYWVQGTGTPSASNNVETVSGTALGSFSKQITGLTQNTTYSFRAFATNTQGTALGSVQSFATNISTVYGYWFVRGCTGTPYANTTIVIRTEESVTPTTTPATAGYSLFYPPNVDCFYAYAQATETQYNNNAGDLSSRTLDPIVTYTSCTQCTGITTTTTTTTPTGNAYTLRYSSSGAIAACSANTNTYYGVDASVRIGITAIYANASLTQSASAGYYSNSTITQYWNGSAWTGGEQLCQE